MKDLLRRYPDIAQVFQFIKKSKIFLGLSQHQFLLELEAWMFLLPSLHVNPAHELII
jgi:hypothetical protein